MEQALEDLEEQDETTTLPVEQTWTAAQEAILVEWSDKAASYRWLHEAAERYYQRMNNWLTVPVIVVSTAAGTANFGVTSLLPPYSSAAAYVIGCATLMAGLVTTLAKFLRVGEKLEAHHSASMSWGKLNRLISVELSLRRDQRVQCQEFVKITRSEVDRLIEMSPMIPQPIVDHFRAEFKDNVTLKKPEICNGIDHTVVCMDAAPRFSPVNSGARSSANTNSTPKSELALDRYKVLPIVAADGAVLTASHEASP
jgi:hypothetical protein